MCGFRDDISAPCVTNVYILLSPCSYHSLTMNLFNTALLRHTMCNIDVGYYGSHPFSPAAHNTQGCHRVWTRLLLPGSACLGGVPSSPPDRAPQERDNRDPSRVNERLSESYCLLVVPLVLQRLGG